MLASDVIGKAAKLLLDESNVRWPTAELIGYINLGQQLIASYKPEATATRQSVTPTAGVSKQTIPATSRALLNVSHNVAADDSVGRQVTFCDRMTLEGYDPSWQIATAADETYHWLHDAEQDPKTYFIYPPLTSGGKKLEIVTSEYPTVVTATGDTLTLGDEYEGPLVDYCVARSLSKDSENMDLAKATQFFKSFEAATGIEISMDEKWNAKMHDKVEVQP